VRPNDNSGAHRGADNNSCFACAGWRAIRLSPLASSDEERLAVALTEIERLRAELRLDCALNEIENMLR